VENSSPKEARGNHSEEKENNGRVGKYKAPLMWQGLGEGIDGVFPLNSQSNVAQKRTKIWVHDRKTKGFLERRWARYILPVGGVNRVHTLDFTG